MENVDLASFKQSKNGKKIISHFSKISTARQLLSIFFDWTVIAMSIFLYKSLGSFYLYIPLVFVVASRQHALLIIMHDAAHLRVSKNLKLNDWISNVFCAWPLLFSTEAYRKNHSAHHAYTNTSQDPDWCRKENNAEWMFPQSRMMATYNIVKYFFLGGYQWILLSWMVTKFDLKKITYLILISSLIIYLGYFTLFALCWLVPLLVVFPVMQKIRSVSEHFGLSYENELKSSRNVIAGPVAQFLISPHNVNYHLTHHLFPSIPHYNLSKFDKLINTEVESMKEAHVNKDYLVFSPSVFEDLIGKRQMFSNFKKVI